MSGLRTPISLFLLLTLLPAAILAWLGWQASAPLVEELRRAARDEVARTLGDQAAALPARVDAAERSSRDRLDRAAAVAREALPFGPPGRVFLDLERHASGALRVCRADGAQVLPRGPTSADLDHLPEWPRYRAVIARLDRGVARGGGGDLTSAMALATPSLRALALAAVLDHDPELAAARLAGLPWADLVHGPLPCQVLARSPAGREHLAMAHREGWLYVAPATERARAEWLAAAGADDEARQRQDLRAWAEEGLRLLVARTALAGGATLELLRDPGALFADLTRGTATGECALTLGLALAAHEQPLWTGPASATVAVPTAWGPIAVSASHRGLAAIEDQAQRQRWLTGVGIGLLLALMTCGVVLVRRALGQERRARALRDEFIANVSHELKTPLTGLRMYAEMLAADGLDATTRDRYGAVAKAEGARLSHLVEDLLDFAALERGTRHLEPEPVDLAATARSLAAAWQPRAERADVTLRCRCAGDAAAMADPTALARVIDNLLQNALRHGRPARDGGKSVVTLCAGPGPVVEVRDNGPGVPLADRERIFGRFERARAGGEGVGIGLALSRDLVRAGGGRLSCTDDGRETVFRLVLPPVPDLPATELPLPGAPEGRGSS